MTDSPEIGRERGNTLGPDINDINDFLLSLPSRRSRRKESKDVCERTGFTSAESLLGLVATEDKARKYSIPKHLAAAVEKLDDDNQDTREQGSRELKKEASLQELVDIRYKAEGITEEQKKRLNDLIKAKAEEKWKECGGDPRKLDRESRDPKMAEVLVAHAPAEYKYSLLQSYFECNSFVWTQTPFKVKDYDKALDKTLDKLACIAAFCEMVNRAARGDDAGKEVKEIASEHRGREIWHQATLLEEHAKRLKDYYKPDNWSEKDKEFFWDQLRISRSKFEDELDRYKEQKRRIEELRRKK